jgi:hypothetical protein
MKHGSTRSIVFTPPSDTHHRRPVDESFTEEDLRWVVVAELLEAALLFKGSRMIAVRLAGDTLIRRACAIHGTGFAPLHPPSQAHLHLLAQGLEVYGPRATAPQGEE